MNLFIVVAVIIIIIIQAKGGLIVLHPSLARASQRENRFLWAHSTYNKQPKRLNYRRGN